jgi:sec-independent protein translocase protein TatA
MPDVSPIQLIIVMIIALVVLGPKRLPEMGKSLGKGIREFKQSVSSDDAPPLPAPPPEAVHAAWTPPNGRDRYDHRTGRG